MDIHTFAQQVDLIKVYIDIINYMVDLESDTSSRSQTPFILKIFNSSILVCSDCSLNNHLNGCITIQNLCHSIIALYGNIVGN